jgi:hypothetical protein
VNHWWKGWLCQATHNADTVQEGFSSRNSFANLEHEKGHYESSYFVPSNAAFTSIMEPQEVLLETERLVGTNKGISEKPIRLKVFSPNVLCVAGLLEPSPALPCMCLIENHREFVTWWALFLPAVKAQWRMAASGLAPTLPCPAWLAPCQPQHAPQHHAIGRPAHRHVY